MNQVFWFVSLGHHAANTQTHCNRKHLHLFIYNTEKRKINLNTLYIVAVLEFVQQSENVIGTQFDLLHV